MMPNRIVFGRIVAIVTCAIVLVGMAACGWAEVDKGRARVTPWSGHWWPTAKGELVKGYRPGEPGPLVKYDLALGRQNRPASNWYMQHEYKPDAPGWWGYCHAWAAAAVVEKEPRQERQSGGQVFHVGDSKGLLCVVHNADPATFWGDRYGDGINDDRQDIRPCLLWQVLRSHMRDRRLPLIIDFDAGPEVWNMPVYQYEVRYTRRGRRVQGRMTLWLVGFSGDADAVGSATGTKTYEFVVRVDGGGNVVLGSGEWTGPSRSDHPDFAWFPVARRTSNPFVEYPAVYRIAFNAEPSEDTVIVSLPPSPGPGGGATEPSSSTASPSTSVSITPPQPGTQTVGPWGVPGQNVLSALPQPLQQLAMLKPPDPNFRIDIRVDRGDFGSASIPVYRVDDPIAIFFVPHRACYVTVLDYGTSGRVSVLRPWWNRKVEPGREYRIPERGGFQVGGPPGYELVRVIGTVKPIDQLVPGLGKTPPTALGSKGVKDILQVQQAGNSWTTNQAVFKIVAKDARPKK